jgi:hypothetical protein
MMKVTLSWSFRHFHRTFFDEGVLQSLGQNHIKKLSQLARLLGILKLVKKRGRPATKSTVKEPALVSKAANEQEEVAPVNNDAGPTQEVEMVDDIFGDDADANGAKETQSSNNLPSNDGGGDPDKVCNFTASEVGANDEGRSTTVDEELTTSHETQGTSRDKDEAPSSEKMPSILEKNPPASLTQWGTEEEEDKNQT